MGDMAKFQAVKNILYLINSLYMKPEYFLVCQTYHNNIVIYFWNMPDISRRSNWIKLNFLKQKSTEKIKF